MSLILASGNLDNDCLQNEPLISHLHPPTSLVPFLGLSLILNLNLTLLNLISFC